MKKILIVDDSTSILQSLKRILEKEDYTVFTSVDAEDAKELITQEKPDLILLDIMLPGISGLDFLKQLTEDVDTRDIPVIVISSRVDSEMMIKAFEAGAKDYMKKPLDLAELLARIKVAFSFAASKKIEIEKINSDDTTLEKIKEDMKNLVNEMKKENINKGIIEKTNKVIKKIETLQIK